MCDQTEVRYLPGDIVWVKLSNSWWPGEVIDESKAEEDITSGLKKKPLAVVKFFNENYYQFPKTLEEIYHYNCLRKDEFIKKGLDLLRAQSKQNITTMKKFPDDVQIAQVRTGGDPDYIDDPKFLPEEKINYWELINNSTPSKKSKKKSVTRTSVIKKTPSKVTFSYPMSEYNDSVNTLSSANNLARNSRSSTTPTSILKRSNKIIGRFRCPECNTILLRPKTLIYHMRFHYKGIIHPSPKVIPQIYQSKFEESSKNKATHLKLSPVLSKKGNSGTKRKSTPDIVETIKKKKIETPKKGKVTIPTTSSSTNDLLNSSTHDSPKKRPKKQKTSKDDDIQESGLYEILKDWDEDPNIEESAFEKSEPADERLIEGITDSESTCLQNDISCEKGNNSNTSVPVCLSLPSVSESTKTPEKSCFDFEDNEDSLNLDQSLKFGQKLPRVINEKQSSTSRFKPDVRVQDNEKLLKDVDDLLQSTHMPDLPDVTSLEPHSANNKNSNHGSEKKTFHSKLPLEIEVSKDVSDPPEKGKNNDDMKLSCYEKESKVSEKNHLCDKKDPEVDIDSVHSSMLSVNENLTSNTVGISINIPEYTETSSNIPSNTETSSNISSNIETSRDRINPPKRVASPSGIIGKSDGLSLSPLAFSDQHSGSKTVSDCSLVNDTKLLHFSGVDESISEDCHNNLIIEDGIPLQNKEVVKKSLFKDKSTNAKNKENKFDLSPKPSLIEDSKAFVTDDIDSAYKNKKSENLIQSSDVRGMAINENQVSIIQHVHNSPSFDQSENLCSINKNVLDLEIKNSLTDIIMKEGLGNKDLEKPSTKKKHDTREPKEVCMEDNNEIIILNSEEKELKLNEINSESINENINVADIPLPVEAYPEKFDEHIKNKNISNLSVEKQKISHKLAKNNEDNKLNDPISELKLGEGKEVEEKIIPENENKAVSNQIPSNQSLNMNPLPIVYREKRIPFLEVSSGRAPTDHPNVDIIRIVLTRKGEESKINIPPGRRPGKTFTINAPEPGFKPFHNLERRVLSFTNPIPSGNDVTSGPPVVQVPSSSSTSKGAVLSTSIEVPSTLIASQGATPYTGNQIPTASATSHRAVPPNSKVPPVSRISQKPRSSILNSQNSTTNSENNQGCGTSSGSTKLMLIKAPDSSKYRLVSSGNSNSQIVLQNVQTSRAQTPNVASNVNSKAPQFLKPLASAKVQRKPKPCIVSNKNILPGASKNVALNKKNNSQIKGASQRLQGRGSANLIIPNNGTKQGPNNSLLIKPQGGPNISPSRGTRSLSASVKGMNSVVIQSSVNSPKGVSSTNILTMQTNKSPFATKPKQTSPNILQKTPKKPTRQNPVAVVSSKTKTASTVNVRSSASIVESAQTPGEPVVFITMDPLGHCVTSNQIIPIESTTNSNSGLLESSGLIDSSSSSTNIENILFSIDGSENFINIANNNSLSTKKSGDILAEALANTQVFQSDSSEVDYQQFPTTSFSANVLETSLTLNQAPIMSPLEVPSTVNTTGSCTVKGKKIEIQPSMPLLSEEETKPQAVFYSESATVPTSHVTFQLIDDSQIVVASNEDISDNSCSQIVYPAGLLPEEEMRPPDLKPQTVNVSIKEDNVLPEFLKGDFNKKPHKSKRCNASRNGNR